MLAAHADELSNIPTAHNRTMLEIMESCVGGDNITAVVHVHGYEPPKSMAKPGTPTDPPPPPSDDNATRVQNIGDFVRTVGMALGLTGPQAAELTEASDPVSAMPIAQKLAILTGVSQKLVAQLGTQAKEISAHIIAGAFESDIQAFDQRAEEATRQHAALAAELKGIEAEIQDRHSDRRHAEAQLSHIPAEAAARRQTYQKRKEEADAEIVLLDTARTAKQAELEALEQQNRRIFLEGQQLQASLGQNQTQISEQAKLAQAALAGHGRTLGGKLDVLRKVSSKPVQQDPQPPMPPIPPPPQPQPSGPPPLPKRQAPKDKPITLRPPQFKAGQPAQPGPRIKGDPILDGSERTTVVAPPRYSSDPEVEAIMASNHDNAKKAELLSGLMMQASNSETRNEANEALNKLFKQA